MSMTPTTRQATPIPMVMYRRQAIGDWERDCGLCITVGVMTVVGAATGGPLPPPPTAVVAMGTVAH